MTRPWWMSAESVAYAVIWIGGSAAFGWHLAKAVVERLG